MRALVLAAFGAAPSVRDVPEPRAPDGGVVVEVEVSGLCRSDWHAIAGHDPDVVLPHVPGHEFAGVVRAVGAGVRWARPGQRVTAPFVQACGECEPCRRGEGQVCLHQVQPGFTRWGSFAEQVVVHRADVNLVRLPDAVGTRAAALLGCRFATAFRALTAVGRLAPGEWVAVHGCGGVGLSAVMIAVAAGARVVGVDPSEDALALAREAGAELALPAGADVREATGGGTHVSIEAIGAEAACAASMAGLRKRGRHVQVGLLAEPPRLPMELVIGRELAVLGSHGMAAHAYPEMLEMIASGRLRPGRLVTHWIGLDHAPAALVGMGEAERAPGVTVIRPNG